MAKNRYSQTSPRDALESWGRALDITGQQMQGIAAQKTERAQQVRLGQAIVDLGKFNTAEDFNKARLNLVPNFSDPLGFIQATDTLSPPTLAERTKAKDAATKLSAEATTAEVKANIATKTQRSEIDRMIAISEQERIDAGAAKEFSTLDKQKKQLEIDKLKIDVATKQNEFEEETDEKSKSLKRANLIIEIEKGINDVNAGRLRIEELRTVYTPSLIRSIIKDLSKIPTDIFGNPLTGNKLVVAQQAQQAQIEKIKELVGADVKDRTGDVDSFVFPGEDGKTTGSPITDPYDD